MKIVYILTLQWHDGIPDGEHEKDFILEKRLDKWDILNFILLNLPLGMSYNDFDASSDIYESDNVYYIDSKNSKNNLTATVKPVLYSENQYFELKETFINK